MLPSMPGGEICKKLREQSNIPIIVLTAKHELLSKITLLDIGANDYLTKPFEIEELFARIRVIFRNNDSIVETGILKFKEIELQQNTRKVLINNTEIKLTKKEFNLLEYFLINRNLVLTRDKILDEVWGWDYDGDFKIIDIYVNSLRKKASIFQNYIKSIRGVGYIFNEEE